MTETLQPTERRFETAPDLYWDTDEPEIVARVVIDGDPQSKARPRLGKGGHTYTPKATVVAERTVAWGYQQALTPGHPIEQGTYGVRLGFHCAGGRPRDVDNLTKLVLDALNGVAWADDRQVTEVSSRLWRYQDDPRTVLVVYRTVADERPTAVCPTCTERFILPPGSTARYCSAQCRATGRRRAAPEEA